MKLGMLGTIALALTFAACSSKGNEASTVPANNAAATTSAAADSSSNKGTSDNDIIMSNMMNSAVMHTLQYPISTP